MITRSNNIFKLTQRLLAPQNKYITTNHSKSIYSIFKNQSIYDGQSISILNLTKRFYNSNTQNTTTPQPSPTPEQPKQDEQKLEETQSKNAPEVTKTEDVNNNKDLNENNSSTTISNTPTGEQPKTETNIENITTDNNNKNNNNNQEKEKTFKEKLISRLKWGSILTVVVGSIGFLFYESHLRTTLPYRRTMDYVLNHREIRKKFGGTVQANKWYKCFERPIKGYVTNKEGGMASYATLSIPIMRPTQKDQERKEKEKKAITSANKEEEEDNLLPEDKEVEGFDGGAQWGYIDVIMTKKTANFFDWQFETLTVHTDDGTEFKLLDNRIQMPTSRRD
ncbi:hypothetical protein DLAC_10886 [Tieghemostelium lacteum]|uniref:Mitochondrial import inner membrane translocase subunit Tim21 n=1 Tax=Tieghemostelium lacteum TaxID=361077 RepID=A0A151Z2M2_TIELA|nr:hypothetical protein DLAC_10886 [Tieghemostelium lacteum]|eukprot:KYQ88200.1 hypothetical protein DLAC_10886 [Tieghemostelium lacteum]